MEVALISIHLVHQHLNSIFLGSSVALAVAHKVLGLRLNKQEKTIVN